MNGRWHPTRRLPVLAHDALPLDERGAAYLDAAAHRVVIFDGAMGTSLQLADLSADDFGGPALEGCNEAAGPVTGPTS